MRVANWRDRVFGEGAGERRWHRAKMKTSSAARAASPAVSEWIERDAIADFETGDVRADLDDFTRGFVTQNNRESRDHPLSAEFPIDDMQVGSADSARPDANEQRGFAG